MSNVIVDKNKIDLLANAISDKSGEPVTMTLEEMVEAVDGIESGITPTGTITITTNGTTDVTNYATANVQVSPTLQSKSVTPTETAQTVTADVGYDGLDEVDVGAISSTYVGSGITRRDGTDIVGGYDDGIYSVDVPKGYYQYSDYYTVPNGTAGTPTATKGTVTNHSVTVTPSVTNTSGYIVGSTINGTAVTVSASELVSGSQTITQNGTVDVTNLAEVVVNVSGGSLTVATKTLTNTSTTQTLSFSSLSGQPKYWFLRATTNVSSSGSTTYYYVTDLFYDGTSVKGNCFRIGSTRRVQNITSGVTQSYSGNTLTITAGSVSTATPGQFYGTTNFGYELVYIY